MEPILEIKKGKGLSVKLMKQIDEIWQNAFPGNDPVKPDNLKRFSGDTFFILRDSKNNVLSLGRLRPVKIIFSGKKYGVQGIADIVSVVKKKGYGKVLMQAILQHLSKNKQTGIGFCKQKNRLFYKKSGFTVKKNLLNRFVYDEENKQKIDDDIVFYIDGKNGFMKNMLKHPKEKAMIPVPHW